MLYVFADETYHGANNELRESVELSTLLSILKVHALFHFILYDVFFAFKFIFVTWWSLYFISQVVVDGSVTYQLCVKKLILHDVCYFT